MKVVSYFAWVFSCFGVNVNARAYHYIVMVVRFLGASGEKVALTSTERAMGASNVIYAVRLCKIFSFRVQYT